tara:strand:+ start:679 stop:1419 length:741 start_codon:yes stop_codon:yes gene_type:complete
MGDIEKVKIKYNELEKKLTNLFNNCGTVWTNYKEKHEELKEVFRFLKLLSANLTDVSINMKNGEDCGELIDKILKELSTVINERETLDKAEQKQLKQLKKEQSDLMGRFNKIRDRLSEADPEMKGKPTEGLTRGETRRLLTEFNKDKNQLEAKIRDLRKKLAIRNRGLDRGQRERVLRQKDKKDIERFRKALRERRGKAKRRGLPRRERQKQIDDLGDALKRLRVTEEPPLKLRGGRIQSRKKNNK